jgi:methylated-DNA-[protein]-cysteine S-methyltransferase
MRKNSVTDYAYILFDTALGRCGLAWGAAGLRAVSFTHGDDAATVAHLKKRAPGAVETENPPPEIARLIEDVIALFEGGKRDLSHARRVGQALGRNPFPIVVPCHRVVGAGGAMTGFSAPGGAVLKRRLLKIEGALEPELFD